MRIEQFIIEKYIFTTRDFAHCLNLRIDSASRKLNLLNKEDVVSRLGRGLWFNSAHPKFSMLALTPYVLGKEQGYVSFISALSYHGVISQIPQKVFLATTGHARLLKADSLIFDLIQIKPAFMKVGVEWCDSFALASPEKALVDCFYLSSRKAKRFYHLPELDLAALKKSRIEKIVSQHQFSKPVEAFILKRVRELF